MNVTIFGTGYVGLVTGICLADLGHTVICVDTDSTKISLLKEGSVPIYEPGLETLLYKNRARLTFTTEAERSLKQAEVIFIAVGTPQSEEGAADLRFVDSVSSTIADHINSFKVIVVKSTVPVGTGDRIEAQLKEKYSGDFAVVSNPEFLKEGDALNDFRLPDRIVIGSENRKAIAVMKRLYQNINAPVLVTDRRSAELIKYTANAFLATKISFINSVASLAQVCGADIERIAEGIGLDKRIGPHFLKAGLGYGGSCFPKDVEALIHTAREYDVSFEILESVGKVNQRQRTLAVNKLKEKLGDLSGKTIGLLGLAFKPNTDDLREAPSLTIIRQLLKEGAKVRGYDPVAGAACAKLFPELEYCGSPYEAITGADAAIVVTEWDEVKRMDPRQIKALMKEALVFDGRNVFDKNEMLALGIEYFGVGK